MAPPGKGRRDRSYRRPSIRISRFTSGLPRVLILHDHAVISEILKLLLADRIDVVAETESGKEAVALSELLVPDVVVTGVMLIDGVSEYYIPALLQTGTRVLMLSEPGDMTRMLELVELGITGIVDISQPPVYLADAVLALAAGGAVLPSDVVDVIASGWRRARRGGTYDAHGSELTNRELEVLGAMTDGLSTKAVAHHLGIAPKTVENHKTRIFDKLGVRTQAQAVALVIGNAGIRGTPNPPIPRHPDPSDPGQASQ
jgi:DNA-binding NarL/FixJ family response regulator